MKDELINIKCAKCSYMGYGEIIMRKDLAKNIIKIVNCLKAAEEGWLWYREISRRTELHHKTVSRLIENHLQMFLDIQTMEPFNVKMVRLKPGTDVNGIFRYLTVKEKLESVRR